MKKCICAPSNICGEQDEGTALKFETDRIIVKGFLFILTVRISRARLNASPDTERAICFQKSWRTGKVLTNERKGWGKECSKHDLS